MSAERERRSVGINQMHVEQFLQAVSAQAARATQHLHTPGFLQISRLHPTEEKLVPARYQFADVPTMITQAVADSEAGFNVYIEGRTVPADLGRKRGALNDTIAVFALVVDSDADKGRGWEPTAQPSCIVETSPGNFHYWYFLEKAVSPEVGQALGKRIRAAVNADSDTDTGTVTQPYRVAGTLNYPSPAKVKRGRVSVPTRFVEMQPILYSPEDIERAFPEPDRKFNGAGGVHKRTTCLSRGFLQSLYRPPAYSEYKDAELRSALNYGDASGKRVWDPNGSYAVWGQIVAPAIASLDWGEKGEDIFVDWSRQTTVDGLFPGEEACRKQIRSYKRGRESACLTEATIFKAAREAGWNEGPRLVHDTLLASAAAVIENASTPNPPVIEVRGGGLSDEATQGEDAIIRARHPIYRRGKNLVRPVVEEVDATRGRRTKVARFAPIHQPYMLSLLCQSAHWMRYDARQNKRVRINPPKDIAQIILDRFGEWKFDPVIGVITTPTLRPDGTLLANPGYDPVTRLILIEPPSMPGIPGRPTRDDALAALNLLDGLLDEFPFADDASRSVALSCLISPVVRGAFTVAPMHAACAPTAGTGKSYLARIIRRM
jgi:hypothetical protein